MAPFLFLLTTAFQNKKSKAKAGDKMFMVLVHQRSLNSEDVLDQSQTHVFPKGSHHHTNLNEGKPSGKSRLQFRYKRYIYLISSCACENMNPPGVCRFVFYSTLPTPQFGLVTLAGSDNLGEGRLANANTLPAAWRGAGDCAMCICILEPSRKVVSFYTS